MKDISIYNRDFKEFCAIFGGMTAEMARDYAKAHGLSHNYDGGCGLVDINYKNICATVCNGQDGRGHVSTSVECWDDADYQLMELRMPQPTEPPLPIPTEVLESLPADLCRSVVTTCTNVRKALVEDGKTPVEIARAFGVTADTRHSAQSEGYILRFHDFAVLLWKANDSTHWNWEGIDQLWLNVRGITWICYVKNLVELLDDIANAESVEGIAKTLNTLARRTAHTTRDLKNDTHYGHDHNVRLELDILTDLCTEMDDRIHRLRNGNDQRKTYLSKVKAMHDTARALAKEGQRVIGRILAEHNGKLTYDDLYEERGDGSMIWLEGEVYVASLIQFPDYICVTTETNTGSLNNNDRLDRLPPIDIVEIAERLCQLFPTIAE